MLLEPLRKEVADARKEVARAKAAAKAVLFWQMMHDPEPQTTKQSVADERGSSSKALLEPLRKEVADARKEVAEAKAAAALAGDDAKAKDLVLFLSHTNTHLSLSLSLSHTHTHTHLTHTHTHTLARSFSFSLTLSRCVPPSLPPSRFHLLSRTITRIFLSSNQLPPPLTRFQAKRAQHKRI